jgi:hypothetical protein
MPLKQSLIDLGACPDAIKWIGRRRSAAKAWAECPRGDWMLWLLARTIGRTTDGRRRVVSAACECARLALPYVSAGDLRPLRAVETAEAWAAGQVPLQEVRLASAAAYAAASAAAAAYAAYAADAAGAKRDAVLAQCANIVRRHFPSPPQIA